MTMHVEPIGLDAALLADSIALTAALDAYNLADSAKELAWRRVLMIERRIIQSQAHTPAGRAVKAEVG